MYAAQRGLSASNSVQEHEALTRLYAFICTIGGQIYIIILHCNGYFIMFVYSLY